MSEAGPVDKYDVDTLTLGPSGHQRRSHPFLLLKHRVQPVEAVIVSITSVRLGLQAGGWEGLTDARSPRPALEF